METYAKTPKEVLETIDYLQQLKHQTAQPADDDNDCSICLETYSSSLSDAGESPVSLPCGHVFGFKCLERYLSPFGYAKNSCPICRRKLFEAPYEPDTVTKLRARLEAFDSYFQRHPRAARPTRTRRLRVLLWQYSLTTEVVSEELHAARAEARAAVRNRNDHPRASPGWHDWMHGTTDSHGGLGTHMLQLQQLQIRVLQQEREQERITRLEASALEADSRARAREQTRSGSLRYSILSHVGIEFEEPAAPSTGDMRPPQHSAHFFSPQRLEETRNQVRQHAQSLGENVINASEDGRQVPSLQQAGRQHPRRSARTGRPPSLAEQALRSQLPPNEASPTQATPTSTMPPAPPVGVYPQATSTWWLPQPTPRQLPSHHLEDALGVPLALRPYFPIENPQQDTPQTMTQSIQPTAREQRLDSFERSLNQRAESQNQRDLDLTRRHEGLEARERDIARREALMNLRDRAAAAQAARDRAIRMDEVD
ncbi:MAG: hypothetical protein Q9168_003798 [Polycauliona sp. 1 TL-2023]